MTGNSRGAIIVLLVGGAKVAFICLIVLAFVVGIM